MKTKRSLSGFALERRVIDAPRMARLAAMNREPRRIFQVKLSSMIYAKT